MFFLTLAAGDRGFFITWHNRLGHQNLCQTKGFWPISRMYVPVLNLRTTMMPDATLCQLRHFIVLDMPVLAILVGDKLYE
jgi:hypothetical protein